MTLAAPVTPDFMMPTPRLNAVDLLDGSMGVGVWPGVGVAESGGETLGVVGRRFAFSNASCTVVIASVSRLRTMNGLVEWSSSLRPP